MSTLQRFVLPLIVLAVLVINVLVFSIRFSVASSRHAIFLPDPAEEEEKKTHEILAQRIKIAREEVDSLLEKRVRVGYREAFADLILQGILYSEYFPLAIINGRMLGEAERIEGAKVIEIKETEVVLQREETPFTLKMGK